MVLKFPESFLRLVLKSKQDKNLTSLYLFRVLLWIILAKKCMTLNENENVFLWKQKCNVLIIFKSCFKWFLILLNQNCFNFLSNNAAHYLQWIRFYFWHKKVKVFKYKLLRKIFKILLKSFFKLKFNGLAVRFWDNLPSIGCWHWTGAAYCSSFIRGSMRLFFVSKLNSLLFGNYKKWFLFKKLFFG